jgi:hypothetical protein
MSINQETAARVRQYAYHHPADTPLEGLWMRQDGPAPGMQEPDLEHFIRPDGIFSDTSPEDQPVPALDDDDSESFSLSDLPWPIPGRLPPAES